MLGLDTQDTALMQEMVREKEMTVQVTSGWWRSYKCHPMLKLRTAEQVANAIVVSSTPAILNCYYDLLESTLKQQHKPYEIFNADESGMPLHPRSLEVIVQSGARHSQVRFTGAKGQVTVLSCCSAAEYAIPRIVIFDRNTLKPELTNGEVPGTMYGH